LLMKTYEVSVLIVTFDLVRYLILKALEKSYKLKDILNKK